MQRRGVDTLVFKNLDQRSVHQSRPLADVRLPWTEFGAVQGVGEVTVRLFGACCSACCSWVLSYSNRSRACNLRCDPTTACLLA